MWQFTGNERPSFAIPPQEGEESVWDYPRPPVCVDDSREVIVQLDDLVIAKTSKAVRVLETASPPTFYIPQSDVNLEHLKQTPGSSFCEWKGAATYWSLDSGDNQIKNVGWSYESPSPRFASIRGFLSFYPAKLICTVDGERVRPQPGGFYGGWVTDEIIGPYKGESGTGGW
jgi:uncharacterized protein (DUF427 family)